MSEQPEKHQSRRPGRKPSSSKQAVSPEAEQVENTRSEQSVSVSGPKTPEYDEKTREAPPYDGPLKLLYEHEGDQLIEEFFPDLQLPGGSDSALNIEINRSALKCDLVYPVYNKEEEQNEILDMELQEGGTAEFLRRICTYFAGLHHKYKKFVRIEVLLPFETNFPDPPYVVRSKKSGKIEMMLNYEPIKLWKIDASRTFKHGHICTYSLLPAMKDVSVPILKQALSKMRAHYTDRQFGEHLICFHNLAERSTTMNEQEKKEIKEVTNVQYNLPWYLKNSPSVDQLLANEKQQAREEGIEKGQRDAVMQVISVRFPTLEALAQPRVQQIHRLEELKQLLADLLTAPDEKAALVLLRLPSA